MYEAECDKYSFYFSRTGSSDFDVCFRFEALNSRARYSWILICCRQVASHCKFVYTDADWSQNTSLKIRQRAVTGKQYFGTRCCCVFGLNQVTVIWTNPLGFCCGVSFVWNCGLRWVGVLLMRRTQSTIFSAELFLIFFWQARIEELEEELEAERNARAKVCSVFTELFVHSVSGNCLFISLCD